MADAFPPHNDPNCPDPNIPAIPIGPILPGDPLPPPEPVIDADLFSFPIPIPETPLGCYCPQVSFNTTQNPDPNGITASGAATPSLNGCCEPIITLDLNIPPADLLNCFCPQVVFTATQNPDPNGVTTSAIVSGSTLNGCCEPIITLDLNIPPADLLNCFCPQVAFTATQNPDPNGITTSAIVSGSTLNGCCEPIITLDLNIPPADLLNCFCPQVAFTATQNPDPNGITTSAIVSGSTLNGCCEPIITLDLNIPPASLLNCFCPQVAFTATQNPDPNGITTSAIVSGSTLNGCCEPIITLDLNIPPLDCFCPQVTFTATQNPDPNGITTSAIVSGSTLNGCCEPIITLDLNIPPDAACQDFSIGGMITRTAGEATFNSSVVALPGQTQEDIFSGSVTTGAVPTPTTTNFAVDMVNSAATAIPNFFKGCLLAFTSGANSGASRIIEEYFFDGVNWRVSFVSAWGSIPAEGDSFIISCGGSLPVGPCDTLTVLDLNIPCAVTTFSTTVNEGSAPVATALSAVVTPQANCDVGLSLTLDLAIPFCGTVISSSGAQAPYSYVVQERNTSTQFNASNCSESGYSTNLAHNAVPNGTQVLVQLVSTGPSTYCFYFPMEPLDEPCSPAPLAESILTRSLYRIRLWPYPAGTLKCITPSSTSVHEISCVDTSGIGWLPVSDPSVPSLTRPTGAKFWYNFDTHVEEYTLFTLKAMYEFLFSGGFFSRSSLHMEVDGVVPPEQISPVIGATLTDQDPLVVYTGEGIWWMKDTWGNVPWIDALALVQGGECVSDTAYCPEPQVGLTYVPYGYSGHYDPFYYYSRSLDSSTERRLILNLFYDNGS